ncbi:MAG: acetolactate decarboxylase [Chitinophagaceae bacterium]|mgnify:CR=1 FL=1
MNKYSLVVTGSLLLLFSNPVEVKIAGAMKNIMHKGDLSAHIALDTVLTQPHIYGLGPAEGIKGELLIIDSKAYWCKTENGKANTSINNKAKAAMLVYAQVPSWKSVTVTDEITDYAALEKLVEKLALQNGQTLDDPFPFIIKGTVLNALYHIIDWKEGTTHTFDNHKQFAQYGNFKKEPVLLLGFYSNKHHSIFTHHSTNMHVHIMDEKKTAVGHIEDISTSANSITLLIPQ